MSSPVGARGAGAPRPTTTSSRRPEADLELLVARKEPLADGVVRLTLVHPQGAPLPGWQPGAHLDLLLGPGLVRPYSLCGDPDDSATLQLAVQRERAGRGASALVHDTLAEGDTVRVRGPRNHFRLVAAPRYLFVAGGIGITPIVPMVAAAARRGADWRLVYGGRTRGAMAFADRLAADHPERVLLCPQDETGLLDLPALLGSPRDDTQVYCCGPGSLLDAVERQCAGWPAGALHTERFTPRDDPVPEDLDTGRAAPDSGRASPPAPPDADQAGSFFDQAPGAPDGRAVSGTTSRSFEVELASTGTVLTVPQDRSILDVLEAAGVPVLSSCREGTCGTCETGVLDGVPEHRDTLLTDEERAMGDVMFVCVSRCASKRLVLDL